MTRISLSTLITAMCFIGCSSGTGGSTTNPFTTGDHGGDNGSGGNDSGAGGSAPSLGGGSGGDQGNGNVTGCSDAAKLIYVIDDHGALHSFDPSLLPSTNAFKLIGTPNCAWGTDPGQQLAIKGPNSMAIDRNAVAWVCDNAGKLFRVSTSDASCTPTSFQSGQHGFGKFGMGFAADSPGTSTDTLYVIDNTTSPTAKDSKGVGKVDLSTMKLAVVGPLDSGLSGLDAELTGTGDAHLFGFVFNQTSSLIGIDKASGHVLSNDTVPVSINPLGFGSLAWAFSFWGGVFYLYTADTSQAPFSDVTEFDPATKKSTTVLSQIGFNIVGAGVSTCAPTTPVK
jgi:hypothetical protein